MAHFSLYSFVFEMRFNKLELTIGYSIAFQYVWGNSSRWLEATNTRYNRLISTLTCH